MLIELITPLMLATAPTILDKGTAVYDHQTQQVVAYNGSKQVLQAYNSTRTFSPYGQPTDADSD